MPRRYKLQTLIIPPAAPAPAAKAMVIVLKNGQLAIQIKNALEIGGIPTRANSLDGINQLNTVPNRLLAGAPSIDLVMIHLGGFENPFEAIDILQDTVPGPEIIALAPPCRNAKERSAYVALGVPVFYQDHDGYLAHAVNKARHLLRITDSESVSSQADPPVIQLPTSPRHATQTAVSSSPSPPKKLETSDFLGSWPSATLVPVQKESPQPAAPIQPEGEKMTTTDYVGQFNALKEQMLADAERFFAEIDDLLAAAVETHQVDVQEIIRAGFRQRSLAQKQERGSGQVFEKGVRDVVCYGKPITLKMGSAMLVEQLIEANGHIVSKDTLANGRSHATLFSYISDIRVALETTHGKGTGEHLRSHRGSGYSLDASVNNKQ